MTARTCFIAVSLLAALPAAAAAQTPSTYVASAGASDLFEKTSSQLVLRSTKDAKVRSFATMMVQDHSKSTAMVKAAAAKAQVKAPPPQMTPDQRSKIAALTKASGEARDKLYWDQQKAAHAQALALHQGYATSGSSEPLKSAAAKIVPVVQHHIDMLNGGGEGAMRHQGH
ncbi:DUF4142 domain-containing protein [Sphingobium sp. DC-2]|uniref:DUF4142 domain-containing protein n=1 Tax=Sphingobium sp. DC-2 TaxID=1303256 RepID=UPI0004C30C18|nr:DUF4142 domain-containing protein [Sphingobium sp. DC-2]